MPSGAELKTFRVALLLAVLAAHHASAEPLQADQGPGAQTAGATAPAADTANRAEALIAEQAQLLAAGRPDAAKERAAAALALFQSVHDRRGEARCETRLGLMALTRRAHQGAREWFAKSLALYGELDDGFSSWSVLYLSAQADLQGGAPERAERSLRQGLERLESVRKADQPIHMDALESFQTMGALVDVNLAKLVVGQADPTSLGPMPTVLQPVVVGVAGVVTRAALGGALMAMERLDAADTELTRALSLSRSLLGIFDGDILYLIGQLRLRQWRLDEAAQALTDGLASLDGLGTLLGSGLPPAASFPLVDQLAEIEIFRGHAAQALAGNDRERDLARRAGYRAFEVVSFLRRAELMTWVGDYAQVAQSLDQAADIATDMGDRELLACVWISRAGSAFGVGRYDEAVRWAGKATAVLQEIGRADFESLSQLALGEAYQLAGAEDEAGVALERAIKLAGTSHFTPVETLSRVVQYWLRAPGSIRGAEVASLQQAVMNMSGGWVPDAARRLVVAGVVGKRDFGSRQTAALARQSLEAAEAHGYRVMAGVARMILLRHYLARRDLPRAQQEAEKALAIFGQSGQEDLAAQARAVVAAVLWAQGRHEEALPLLRESVEALDKLADRVRSDPLLTAFLGGDRRELHELVVDVLVRSGRQSEAFAVAEKARAQGLLRLLESQQLRPGRGAAAALPAQAEDLRRQIRQREQLLAVQSGEAAARISSEIEGLRRELDELLLRIRETNPDYADLVSARPASIEAIQQSLPADATIISYFTKTQPWVAWTIDRQQVRWFPLPLTAADIPAVTCFAQQAGRRRDAAELAGWQRAVGEKGGPRAKRSAVRVPRGTGACADAEKLSTKLYQGLIAPLAATLGSRRLIVVPHDVLHLLPFAALRNHRTGRYLIEEHALTYLPSASLLPLLSNRRHGAVLSRAVVLGNPTPAEPGLRPLPWAEQEAKEVASIFGVEPLIGPDATLSRLQERLGQGADILHLAAHGFLLPRHPRFSYVALAADARHDGRLEVEEIFSGLDLHGVNLVVLSACETALGQRTGGDEVIGMVRAFLYAGSSAVLGTLWRIDDSASASLMVDFYKRLRQGVDAGESLRQAQLTMLHDGRTRDPYFWAAFALNGDPSVGLPQGVTSSAP